MDDIQYIEKMHGRLFGMLKELHCICEDNNITYYMLNGTALGAKRHQGFIPWDDDVDVGMPRPDYERFAALPKSKFPDYLELRWYRNTEDSPFQFIKFVDNRTTLKEIGYENYLEGIYIDVFPLDGARKDGFMENFRRRIIWNLHLMVITKCSSRRKTTALKRFLARFVKLLNVDVLHQLLEKELLNIPYESSPMTANYLGAWTKREVMEKRVFGTPRLYVFGDASFYGPELIDEYLTNVYGDYMTPPPPEERTFRHSYPLLDFDTPFREYGKSGMN